MATPHQGKKPEPRNTKQTPAATTKDAGVVAPVQAKPTDWERIELDYRAGIKTLRQIAGENSISEGAIRKRAKRDDWTRDLSERIQDKAEQLVRKDVVRKVVRTESALTERVLVDVNAQAVADVRLGQRDDIGRAKGITRRLLDELEDSAQAYELDARVKMSKTLAETLRIVIDMERQAFGMDAKGADGAAPGTAGYVPPAIRIVHVSAPQRDGGDDE